MPKFSIIVPIYNVEKYLNKCIDSVLAQSFSDFELILVDDGSPDSCPEICDEYAEKDSRVKVIHKKNAGVSAARNTGLDNCCGELVWFVDGDDYILENSLERISEIFTEDIDIMNFGDVLVKDCIDSPEKDSKYSYDFTGVANKEDIRILMKTACTKVLLPHPWRNIYKKSFLSEIGIHQAEALSLGEDSVFNMEAYLRAEKVLFTTEKFYAYRMRKDGLSKATKKKFDLKLLKNLELYDKLRDEKYEQFCETPDEDYYKDAGKYTIVVLLEHNLLRKFFKSESKSNYNIYKRIVTSEMVKKAFLRFNIRDIKTKTPEWIAFWGIEKKLYFFSYLIYRFIIFKK